LTPDLLESKREILRCAQDDKIERAWETVVPRMNPWA
jgi:hypothetical protein